MQIGWAIVVFIISLIVIFIAADFVLDGIEELGEIWKVPTILLAYILIGIDLEETVASWGAALNGLPNIAIGNVIGNTIISVCFCFTLPAMFFEISFKKIQKWVLPAILLFGFWIILYMVFPQFRIVLGILSILSYVGFITANIFTKSPIFEDKEEKEEDEEEEGEEESVNSAKKIWRAIIMLVIGIVSLYFASDWLMKSVQNILSSVNINEGVFGLIIIAAGTNVEEYMILFKSIKRKTPEVGLRGLLGKIIWNCGITFGVSLLLIKANPSIPLSLFVNGILLFGLILPTLIFIVLKNKKLTWKSSIPLLFFFGTYITISFIL